MDIVMFVIIRCVATVGFSSLKAHALTQQAEKSLLICSWSAVDSGVVRKQGFLSSKMNLQGNSYPRYQGNVPTSFSTGPTGQNWVEESR